ncbi:MAG: TetR/AcrR family transcriptional regulator [Ruminococcaceae bacterium]|nr:TetR/AcrR family transcriptional regulator [Oscillospiraceae bacterium]
MLNNIVKRRMRLKPLTETEIDIIRSATKLFLQNGYTQTTFKMIEADSGVKVGAITYHFHSKEEMLQILIEELMDYHAGLIDDMHDDMQSALMAYAMEIAVQVALCENNRNAWDLYYSGYSLPLTYEHIKGWAAEKNYSLLGSRLPDWTESDFRDKEVIASGIELAALKTFCDRGFTLDKKISLCLDSMMMLYEIPKAERQEVIQKILLRDYKKIAKDMFDKFVKRLDNDIVN